MMSSILMKMEISEQGQTDLVVSRLAFFVYFLFSLLDFV